MSDDNGIQILRGLSETDELLTGTDGGDTLAGGSGDDTLNGGGGDDRLVGRAGNDSISGGDGDDRLGAGAGDDTLDGGAGDDVLWDGNGADRHSGGLGNDILAGHAGNDSLFGGDGFDRIYGGIGDDALSGGGGTDLVYGGADNDTVTGGSGFDKLTGGDGADVFVIEPGSGKDVIRDFQPGSDKIDVTPLNLGLSFDHLIIRQMGPHTWINFRGDEGLTLYNTDASSISASDFTGLSQSSTASIRLIDRGDSSQLAGGDGDDYVRGGTGANSLSGGSGDDVIWDGDGDDSLDGGAGDDRLRAGDGNDTLNGGDGADRLRAGDGNDQANGGAGDDMVFGGAGDDTLDGGSGADILTGGAGSDTFIAGDGGDVIRDFTSGEDVIDLSGRNLSFSDLTVQAVGPHALIAMPDGDTVLLFNTQPGNLSAGDFDFGTAAPPQADPGDLFGTDGDDSIAAIDVNSLSGLAGNDTLDLRANFGEALGGDGNDDITIGLSPSLGGIASAEAFGGAGDDTIRTLDQDSSAEGGDGNDLIIVADRSFVDGGAGDDTLSYSGDGVAIYDASYREFPENAAGGLLVDGRISATRGIENLGVGVVAGIIGRLGSSDSEVIGDDDALQESNFGVSNMFAGAGDDTVYGFAGADNIKGQFGDDLLFGGVGDDTVLGDAGNDTLDGGAGSDTLTGGDGADVFRLLPGGGSDIVTDFVIGEDRIDVTGQQLTDLDVQINSVGDGTEILLTDGTSILLNSVDSQAFQQSEEVFLGLLQSPSSSEGNADDETLTGSTDNETISGNGGDDVLEGVSGIDQLFGGEGNDSLFGNIADNSTGDGHDLLSGGAGDDLLKAAGGENTLLGGAGNDTLVADAGDNAMSGGEGADVFVLSDAVQTLLVSDFAVGEDVLDLRSRDTSLDRLAIEAEGFDTRIEISDGSSILLAGVNIVDVNLSIFVGLAPPTPEIGNQTGSEGGDTLTGAGARNVLGLGGNDVIDLVATRAEAFGGDGDDTITLGIADPDDLLASVNGYGGLGDDLITIASGGHGDVFGGEGDDTLHIDGDGPAVVDLDRGHILMNGEIGRIGGFEHYTGNVFFGSIGEAFTDGYTGTSDDDLIADGTGGFHAEAVIDGGAGDDTLVGDTGNDTIRGQYGNDIIFGGAGVDIIDGKAGSDTLFGGEGHDLLYGDSGADTLFGGDGIDQLVGGAGFDRLTGGEGADRFVLQAVPGVDTITDFVRGQDLLVTHELGAGFDDLTFTVSGNRLSIFAGGDEVARLENVDTLTADDFLTGGPLDNVVAGNLDGGPGIDTVNFGPEVAFVDPGVYFFNRETGDHFGGARFYDENGDTLGSISNVESFVLDPSREPAAGDDVLFSDHSDSLRGGDGNDTIFGGDHNRLIPYHFQTSEHFGEGGDDLIIGGSVAETLYGGAGNDTLYGGARGGVLDGGDGDDLLISGDFTNLLYREESMFGGDGNDTLIGGDMGNRMAGGAGNNLYRGGQETDHFTFGVGNDTLLFDDRLDDEHNIDIIQEFGVHGIDRIDMSQIGAAFEDLTFVDRGIILDGRRILNVFTEEDRALEEDDFIF